MGTLEGLVCTINGGTVPVGMRRKIVCEIAVTCVRARSMLTPGWKRSLTMATPLNVSERTSRRSQSTLLSVAVSENEVIFAAISVGLSPP